jgi:hypothetical protein
MNQKNQNLTQKMIANGITEDDIMEIFDDEDEYVIWGIQEFGLDAIEHELTFDDADTQAEAIDEMLAPGFVHTYRVNGRFVMVDVRNNIQLNPNL